ncbi:MAG: transglutaminase family protein [Lachnospiraceae bacterium]|nr:transglutaminase family protein [Lachnospiraceae bacterium]
MKRLKFDYSMVISYDTAIENCHYTIKCFPAENERQRLEELHISIRPRNSSGNGIDSFGNRYIYGTVLRPHDTFSFHTSGIVTVGMAESEAAANEGMMGAYRYPFGLTVPGDGLRYYFAGMDFSGRASDFDKAVYLMHRLYDDFSYVKGITGVNTTAEEAWKLGKGVCQDYAHILTALCRMAGIPARYVAGMLIGEGFSHAWVEICTGGRWYALDPTNNCVVTDSHIKLGVGRDASDCMVNRGVLHGNARQKQSVKVIVKEV